MNKSGIETIKDKLKALNLSEQKIEERRENYYQKAKNLYPQMQPISKVEYETLRDRFNDGELDMEHEIINKSLAYIFSPVIGLYSRYDLSQLDFEDALNMSYLNAYNYIRYKDFIMPKNRARLNYELEQRLYVQIIRQYFATKRKNIHLANNTNIDIDRLLDVEYMFSDSDENIYKEEIVKEIKKLIYKLPKRSQIVFNLSYNKGMCDADVAKRIGVSRQLVCLIKADIKSKIHQHLLQKMKYDATANIIER
ncbi:MAG: hypothetical protein IKM43_03395 [Clostridia bacterium]|nr:hypothetical protein [Clostridia bacterium]